MWVNTTKSSNINGKKGMVLCIISIVSIERNVHITMNICIDTTKNIYMNMNVKANMNGMWNEVKYGCKYKYEDRYK